jgi:uncharacterized Ntn-hydrolase superfamily protein
MRHLYIFLVLFVSQVNAQDTFSIVALDSITGEVGSAGASCVDLDLFFGFEDDFLGELFPGQGAINTQAYYLQANQLNARTRMNAGDTPQEIIDWLVANDIQGTPQFRQYGITALVDGSPQSAGHTGSSTDDYKNHITGPGYSIQGNILLGAAILDSMETRFLNAEGDLACRLMAALQGANVLGADTRCASNGTSSLFAFVKVAQPEDDFGDPSFVRSVRTNDGDGIEPIDSLQSIFNSTWICSPVGLDEGSAFPYTVFPNPTQNSLTVLLGNEEIVLLELIDLNGRLIHTERATVNIEMDLSSLDAGLYILQVSNEKGTFRTEVMKE